jgi:hypothetical protein
VLLGPTSLHQPSGLTVSQTEPPREDASPVDHPIDQIPIRDPVRSLADQLEVLHALLRPFQRVG